MLLRHGGRRAATTARRKSLLDAPSERQAKLVCAKCENHLVDSSDLFFLHWQRGVHVASFQNAALEHLKTTEHPLASVQPWKQAKLNCTKCDLGVATRATVRGQEATLFSAKHVSLKLPMGSSPIVSISGVPSDILRFTSWSDLMAQVAAAPTLKAVLKIREDKKETPTSAQPTDHKEINTRILLAQSAIDVLQLVATESNLNHVNTLTAFQRFAMFHQRTLQDIARLKKQRIPHVVHVDDDDAARLDLYKVQLQRYHHDLNLIYSTRFWNLVTEMERQCQMHMRYVPSRYLFFLLKSLLALHLAPSKLMENLAAQVTYRLPQERYAVDKLVHFLHGFAILSASDEGARAWIEPTFRQVASHVLTQGATPELLSMAAWACAVAKVHHTALIDAVVDAANAHPDPGVTFSTQVYQVHLEASLANLPTTHSLAPSRVKLFKQALAQQQHGNVSSTLHEDVSATLLQMSVPHSNEFVMEHGYSLDIALVSDRIGIEVNGPSHYQLRSNPSERYLLGPSMLKMRHVQRAGWTVIQLAYEDFCKLPLGKPRQEYLSLLLEVAMASRVDPK